jgi:hypothetical protein
VSEDRYKSENTGPPNGGKMPPDEARALWLVILQALAMVTAAIRRHVGVKGSCEGCGKVL